MDWKIELVPVPVSDVDASKNFYVNQVGFNADYDERINEGLRFVQLTPPGSACSVVIGPGTTDMVPGTQRIQVVVPSAADARQHLVDHGVAASDITPLDWGMFVYFSDPDGNQWSLQEMPEIPPTLPSQL
ncbi:VOC family protein [Arthrobacter sp. zg-Y1110]|uniref:VOC family protein n=1 Tax=Arthrobacter sp. zg-Y1110 TaxID=2886932 RepID=UPI001D13EB18|nr:VOC family protein [Arthrobacter sp. zg-Y1110]MCC3291860.1 VOC family protein [Arthrobacter sp. zg-Y1110]UWX85688.1 VOC family protein [Arthrobacter sp. zg-Y1110]